MNVLSHERKRRQTTLPTPTMAGKSGARWRGQGRMSPFSKSKLQSDGRRKTHFRSPRKCSRADSIHAYRSAPRDLRISQLHLCVLEPGGGRTRLRPGRGRAKPEPGEQPDLIYSRFNHPNAEIFESQIVPLENGARAAIVFNSGMAAITTALFTFLRPGDAILYTVPITAAHSHSLRDFSNPGASQVSRSGRARLRPLRMPSVPLRICA